MGKGTFGKTLMQTAATAGLGGVMDLAGGAIGQIFAKKNLERQTAASKELTDYNTEKQKEMWDYTNYTNQVKHMKEAGLNVGLMYGMSGGGGQTAQIAQGSAGMPSGGNGGNLSMAAAAGMMQTQADIELKESQARLNNVEADKKAGIDTDKATAEKLLTQQNERLAKIQADAAEQTYWESVGRIIEEARIVHEELDAAVRNNHIGRKTQETQIKQARRNLVKTNAEIILIKANARNVNMDTNYVQKQVETFYERLAGELSAIAIQGRNATTNEKNAATQQAAQAVDREFKEKLIELGQWEIFTNGAGKVMQMLTPVKGAAK